MVSLSTDVAEVKLVASMGNIRAVTLSWVVVDCVLAALLVMFMLKGYQERRRAIQLRQQGFVSQ